MWLSREILGLPLNSEPSVGSAGSGEPYEENISFERMLV
jgi:hypothetical protein